jgi:hypothetical protein
MLTAYKDPLFFKAVKDKFIEKRAVFTDIDIDLSNIDHAVLDDHNGDILLTVLDVQSKAEESNLPQNVVDAFIAKDYKTLLTYVPPPTEMIRTRLDYRRAAGVFRYNPFLS